MQDIDAHEFGRLLEEVAECYDRKPPSEAAAKMWFRALKEFLYPDVRSTLLHWLKTKSKAPTIADITGQLRDRSSASLEQRAARDKERFKGPHLGPTEKGRSISATIKQLLVEDRHRDPKKWARDIVAMHEAGDPVTPLQLSMATNALYVRAIHE